MDREIAHMQMFSAALATVQPNFPPAILQGDPRFTHAYFNLSNGASARGPWNQGQGPWEDGHEWTYIEDPVQHVRQTNGLAKMAENDAPRQDAMKRSKELDERKMQEVSRAVPDTENQWSAYPQRSLESPSLKKAS